MKALFAVLAAGAVLAQQAPPPADDGKPTVFHLDTRIVVCHTTVVDRTGHLVTNLPETAFAVYENKVRQEIRRFKREDVPVSLGLVIDNSGSMRNKLAQVKAAAVALVKESNPQDEAFVVNFNDTAYLDNPKDKPFTSDIKDLEQALAKIDTRGGTAMRDAIQMSIDHLKGAHRDKKVLVVITDGNDNSSVVNMDAILRAAHRSDVLIYGVGLLTEEEHREASHARKALNDLAEATGGKTFFPKDVAEVDTIARQVAHDIRNQYVIEYSPSNSVMDGTFRAIKITARAPGTTVRTRSGYYATPDSK
ncbi:MAG: VWA domain-containing protein [Acidobacteriota bacterium]|nr:VWA domain-containing protein [Acidobacteriota bacterium]